ncbi:MAG TPA: hypothetical protein DCS63_10770, partial [Elusimicrobia bacterium]|nr:hypothetical protein [Elusimicrobiota bacterium]
MGIYTLSCVFLLAALLCASVAPDARAAAITWDGAGGDTNWYTANNWNPDGVPGSADDITINAAVGVVVNVSSPAINFNTLALGAAGGGTAVTITLSTGIASGGSFTIHNGAMLVQNSTETLKISGNLTVEPGGRITHGNNATIRAYVVSLDVAGTFDLQAGSTITVDGLGYDGSSIGAGWGPGGGPSGVNYNGCGGGHGGTGGVCKSAGGGVVNDVGSYPTDLGSGGGRSYNGGLGGAGGGAIILKAGTLTLNGRITANGAAGGNNSYGAGGGAGGSVNITATSFSGSGVILATGAVGGAGDYVGGGGGGGRILVHITGTGDPCALTTYVSGGASGGTYSGAGADGTVALFNSAGAGKMWVGSVGDSNWYTASNWAPAGVPSASDGVIIGP